MPLPALVLSALLATAPPGSSRVPVPGLPGTPDASAPGDALGARLAHDTGAPGQQGVGAAPAAPAAAREVVVRLVPGARPPVVALTQGATVRLVIHGQPGMVLHLHGYDVDAATGPDGIAVIALDPRHAGRFPAMTHGEDAVLGARETAAFYLEIAAP